MQIKVVAASLAALASELVQGPAISGAFVLNTGDAGLLRSLDRLSAASASKRTPTGSSIAAHTEHVRYGLSLMNRWGAGQNPWEDADWAAAWKRTKVSDAEWSRLRDDLAREARAWVAMLGQPRDVNPTELNSMIGSIVHLAYHLGAIRQIDVQARGPAESA